MVQIPWPEDCRLIETGDYCSEIALAQRKLGWMPVTDIHTGIAASVAFYRRQIKVPMGLGMRTKLQPFSTRGRGITTVPIFSASAEVSV